MSKTNLERIVLRADAALSAAEDSAAVDLDKLDGPIYIQAVWSGGATTPNYDIFVEVSNDGVTWTEVASSRKTITSIAGNDGWEITTGAAFLRFGIEKTTGTYSSFAVNLSARKPN